jgi:hypothetical protein
MLVQTSPSRKIAKMNGVDPQVCLTDTTGHIADHKITRLDELMPRRYAQTRA